ncbi:hypothetical protein [Peptoniphilus senegalensis]|uniref:hypothetical protein n=1 Tax=Peptoniphilus senegalensis TaxID=1465757 RepID=UPI0002DEED42|nr:hypothetical protein [Peptoniphilus senegalensis]
MLEKQDYKILKYMSQFDKIHIDKILEKFPESKYSTKFRIEKLSKVKYSNSGFPLSNSSYISELNKKDDEDPFGNLAYTGIYELTELGYAELQDHKSQILDYWLKEIVRSITFPIIVSFVTALITSLVTIKLLK